MSTWQEHERLQREKEYQAFLREHSDKGQPFELEILFDGPPGPEGGRFIECQDAATGEGLGWGKWSNNGDGTWSLCGLAIKSPRFDADHCQCAACLADGPHWSDCAVHNEPAYPNGSCSCGRGALGEDT